MEYLYPYKKRGFHPLCYDNDRLLASRGNSVLEITDPFGKGNMIGRYNGGFVKKILTKSALYKRILRRGFHDLTVDEKGNSVAVVNKQILFKPWNENIFRPVFNSFRGSRPLRLTYADGLFCFGEYFGNPERKEVHIYASENGKDWWPAYTFPMGSIRHVHGIIEDSEKRGIWVFTGDSDKESKIWFTKDQFRTLKPVVEGSQKARAVNIIAEKDRLIIPMDSPLEQNYIQEYNLDTKELLDLAKIPGSAFHAIESDGIMLVSTVTEPSDVNKTDAATLWGSLDGKRWKCICELKKDWFPVRFQWIFRYAEIVLTPGNNNTPYITAFGRALKGRDNCMLVWKKEELRKFLE